MRAGPWPVDVVAETQSSALPSCSTSTTKCGVVGRAVQQVATGCQSCLTASSSLRSVDRGQSIVHAPLHGRGRRRRWDRRPADACRRHPPSWMVCNTAAKVSGASASCGRSAAESAIGSFARRSRLASSGGRIGEALGGTAPKRLVRWMGITVIGEHDIAARDADIVEIGLQPCESSVTAEMQSGNGSASSRGPGDLGDLVAGQRIGGGAVGSSSRSASTVGQPHHMAMGGIGIAGRAGRRAQHFLEQQHVARAQSRQMAGQRRRASRPWAGSSAGRPRRRTEISLCA